MQEIIEQLQKLRRRAWLSLLTQRVSLIVTATIGVLLLLILLDYLLRLPSGVRCTVLVAGLMGLGYALWTFVRSALAFEPSLPQMALRVESSMPNVAGRLASSVEFALQGIDQTNELASRSVRDTLTRLRGESMTDALKRGITARDLGLLAAVTAVALALMLSNPAAAHTGLVRALIPWTDARWPARTGVESLMKDVLPGEFVHPRGQALALRARVTRGEEDQRVSVRYRLSRDGAFGDWEELVLTHQGNGIHERLIDTSADRLEVTFTTADDQTVPEEVLLVPPPTVIRATLSTTPPPYAVGRIAPQTLELGSGTDYRSVTETPVLIGSELHLVLTLNKILPVPAAGAERDEWLVRTLGWDGAAPPAFASEPGPPVQWSLHWSADQTRSLPINLEDEHGLRNSEPIRYQIEIAEDRPPAVTMIEPQADESVLPTAIVPLVSEATDDVAVSKIGIRAIVQRQGDAAERGPGWPEAEPGWTRSIEIDAATATLAEELALADLEPAEGDIVLVQGVAEDTFELEGERHPQAQSPIRRLRVISELDFATAIRRQLGAIRQNAIRIEALQAELQDDVIDDGVQPGLDRAQAQIGERIAAQQEMVEDVDRQLQMNRLDDESLDDLLAQAGDLLDFAGRAANRAVEALEQRQRGGSGAPEDEARPNEERAARAGEADDLPDLREPREEDRSIVDAQQETREELADLIQLLDRDEDTWVVTRQLEDLLAQQAQLQSDTAQLRQETVGRDRSELSEQEQAELDRIAEAQDELPEQARQLMEELRKRAESMEQVDPEASAGMRSAARTGEQRELDRDMEKAAERARENQLQNATAMQEQARQTLQRMLEDIEESKRAQTAQLVRQLESLIESIERLIAVQENELIALAAGLAEGQLSGRDRAMIRLNQNTQAVAGEARAAGQEARRIARTLDRAADAQGAAILALRAAPPDGAETELAENRALELLREARDLAQELQQKTQEEETRQRREELIDAYRALAERQVVIREQTVELAQEQELDRRQLMDARRLASRQDELANELDDLRRTSQEVANAPVFSLVHRKIDVWSKQISEELREARVNVNVTDRQQAVASAIGRLIEALEESMAPPEEFAGENQPTGAGGAGGQPLIPPVSELKLVQGVQQEIYNETRALDSRTDLDDASRRQRLRDLGQEQRELMDVGRQILERLQPGSGAPPAPEDQAPPPPEPGQEEEP